MTSRHEDDGGGRDGYDTQQDREYERLLAKVKRLEADQADWRKGVELIATALGENHLCCVSLAMSALQLREWAERMHDAIWTTTGNPNQAKLSRLGDELEEYLHNKNPVKAAPSGLQAGG